MSVLTNLYPPIVDTYAPAFLINSGMSEKDTCKVYFKLSPYNKITDIVNAHVTVRNQNTNVSMLDKTQYPCEIMLTDVYTDDSVTGDYKYYIKILKTDIQGGNFEIDQYYKVQIRFTGKDATPISMAVPQSIDNWLNVNMNYFSEWSTVCLVRGISAPTLTVQGFIPGQTSTLNWSIANTQLNGKLTFADENEKETLRSYRIKLIGSEDQILIDSGELYTRDSVDINSFTYTIKYALQTSYRYRLDIEYTTQNYYKEIQTYYFQCIPQSSLQLDIVMHGEMDPENGRIGIHIQKGNINQTYTGKMIIRRTSSQSNFTIWEDMYIRDFDNASVIDFTWYDYTIESGVWYDYAAQGVEAGTDLRGQMTRFVEPCMMEFEHMYLTSPDKQLKIQFNPTISSLKTIYSESKNDTLGSKYPYIRRNGYTEYVQIPISGLISSEMDEEGLFETRETIYGENLHYYDDYNKEYEISSHSDRIYEKAFRDKVLDFLHEDNLKLFRSPTEGNYIVRIMDISLSPQTTLGRRLWTFSGTAYQMEDYTVEKLQELGFIVEEMN